MRAKALGAAVCALLGLAAGGVRAGDKASPPAAPGPLQEPGQVEAAEQANLYSAIPAYAESVSVDIGDHVKKGDVLAVLAAPDLKAELKQKAALLDVAKAQVEQAKRSIDAAEASMEAVKAHLDGAQAAVTCAKAEGDYRKAELKRFDQLEQNKSIDSQIVDEKREQVAAAEAAVESMEAAVKAARADAAGAAAKYAAAQADVLVAEARGRGRGRRAARTGHARFHPTASAFRRRRRSTFRVSRRLRPAAFGRPADAALRRGAGRYRPRRRGRAGKGCGANEARRTGRRPSRTR